MGDDAVLPQDATANPPSSVEALPVEVLNELEALSALPNMDLVVLQSKPAEDWNYTPEDHLILGDKLQFAPDAQWTPQVLRTSLLAALRAILPSGCTTGVNAYDFFHGHIGVPRDANRVSDDEPSDSPDLPEPLQTLKANYERLRTDEYERVLGDSWTVTAENLEAFKDAVETVAQAAKELLKAGVAWAGAELVFHTYEFNRPSDMEAGDRRRNWGMPAAGGTPKMLDLPRKPDGSEPDGSSWLQLYKSVFQFCFLIDLTGSIHVRPDSGRELPVITGSL